MKQEIREARRACRWQKLAAAYTDGTLRGKKAADMRAHLCTGCAQCTAAVEKEARLRAIYASAVPAPNKERMQSIEDRVLASVRSAPIAAAMGAPSRSRVRSRVWQTACGIVAAMLVVAGLARVAPMLLVTADNDSKEANIGGVVFDEIKNMDISNGKGEMAEDGDDTLAVEDESLNGILADEYDKTLEDIEPSYSYSQNDNLTPPMDNEREEVEMENAPTESVPAMGTASATATVPECDEESAEMRVQTVLVTEADAERAYDLLASLALTNGEEITRVTGGWSVSSALCDALCAALDSADISYRTDVADMTADKEQDGRLYLLWTP